MIHTRITAMLLVIGMILFTTALAECNLGGMAIINDEGVFYSGLGENGETGVYRKDANARTVKLWDAGAYLITSSNGRLMISATDDKGETNSYILDKDGETLYKGGFSYLHSVSFADGVFSGQFMITFKNGEAECVELLDDYCLAQAVYENRLYYYDQSAYALASAMDYDISALYTVEMNSGDVRRAAGEGARLIGVEDGFIVYALDDFYSLENGATERIKVDRGIYKADSDGENAARLCVPASYDDGFYELYTEVSDGVVYGICYNFDSEENVPPMVLKRVTLGGEILDDIPVDFGELIGVKDKKAYVLSYRMDGNFEYVRDDIISVDTDTGVKENLFAGREFIMSAYFDYSDRSCCAVYGDRLYFIAAEKGDEFVRLWSANTDGSDLKAVAALFDA